MTTPTRLRACGSRNGQRLTLGARRADVALGDAERDAHDGLEVLDDPAGADELDALQLVVGLARLHEGGDPRVAAEVHDLLALGEGPERHLLVEEAVPHGHEVRMSGRTDGGDVQGVAVVEEGVDLRRASWRSARGGSASPNPRPAPLRPSPLGRPAQATQKGEIRNSSGATGQSRWRRPSATASGPAGPHSADAEARARHVVAELPRRARPNRGASAPPARASAGSRRPTPPTSHTGTSAQ